MIEENQRTALGAKVCWAQLACFFLFQCLGPSFRLGETLFFFFTSTPAIRRAVDMQKLPTPSRQAIDYRRRSNAFPPLRSECAAAEIMAEPL